MVPPQAALLHHRRPTTLSRAASAHGRHGLRQPDSQTAKEVGIECILGNHSQAEKSKLSTKLSVSPVLKPKKRKYGCRVSHVSHAILYPELNQQHSGGPEDFFGTDRMKESADSTRTASQKVNRENQNVNHQLTRLQRQLPQSPCDIRRFGRFGLIDTKLKTRLKLSFAKAFPFAINGRTMITAGICVLSLLAFASLTSIFII